jgi:MEMO1 family protein
MNSWYPQNKEELNKVLEKFLTEKHKSKVNDKEEIHGIIVPHAGYVFSGAIAGKAFSLLREKEKAIVIAPSHYSAFYGLKSIEKIETPLGKIKITRNSYEKIDYEHAIDNQIPFLQKLGFKEILPIVVGQINEKEADEIAEELIRKYKDYVFVISTDLSHFAQYSEAVKTDKKTIEIIENLDLKNLEKIDACGALPLLIAMNLCKKIGWKPKLLEYKNSGDVIGEKSSVVGYASFYF